MFSAILSVAILLSYFVYIFKLRGNNNDKLLIAIMLIIVFLHFVKYFLVSLVFTEQYIWEGRGVRLDFLFNFDNFTTPFCICSLGFPIIHSFK